MIFSDNKALVDFARREGIYPNPALIESAPTDTEVLIGGKKYLMFSSNNYLSLANDPEIKTAIVDAVNKYGMGSGGSRLISGTTPPQIALEQAIARFKGAEDAIVFSTGFMTNSGVIEALLNTPVVSARGFFKKLFGFSRAAVFSDELDHASIVDGCRISKAKIFVYKHKDMKDLERLLKWFGWMFAKKLIVSDGVFSMHGDVAPLPEILALGEKYGALTMIDDAHATGVLGKTGRGTAEFFNSEKHPDIMMGTFTKAMGGVGGYIAGSKELIDFLRIAARTYIFTAPLPPAIAAGLAKSVELVARDTTRMEKMWKNVHYLKERLTAEGFQFGDSVTPIIPIMIGDEAKGVAVSKRLLDEGIFAACAQWPAVPKKHAILRVTAMANHTEAQMDKLLTALKKVKKEMNL